MERQWSKYGQIVTLIHATLCIHCLRVSAAAGDVRVYRLAGPKRDENGWVDAGGGRECMRVWFDVGKMILLLQYDIICIILALSVCHTSPAMV